MIGEHGGMTGGNAGGFHDLLGEGLGPLQPRAVGPGTEHGETPVAQLVGQTGHQRGLRPHHGQVDPSRSTKATRLGISSASMATISASCGDAGVPGRAQQTAHAGAALERRAPGHARELPSADHQHVRTAGQIAMAGLLSPAAAALTLGWGTLMCCSRLGPTEIREMGTPHLPHDEVEVVDGLLGQILHARGPGDVALPAGELLVDRLHLGRRPPARRASRSTLSRRNGSRCRP